MHPVYGHKLLSNSIRDTEVVYTRSGDAADSLTRLRNSTKYFGEPLTNNAPPVCIHANLKSWMGQDGRGPFDGVDLGHQGRVDQASRVEDIIAGSFGKFAVID